MKQQQFLNLSTAEEAEDHFLQAVQPQPCGEEQILLENTRERILLDESFQTGMDKSQEQIVFCGDSPNDVPMFGFFQNSVGVANIIDYAEELEQQPCWVTQKRAAAGFVELAEALMAAHSDA